MGPKQDNAKQDIASLSQQIDISVLSKCINKLDGTRDKLNPFLSNCRNAIELAAPNQKDALFVYIMSQLEVSNPRDRSPGGGSLGAASLGARREAPTVHKRAPSVRSDERPLATQGDLLNSIKFQRVLRDAVEKEKQSNVILDKFKLWPKEKSTTRMDRKSVDIKLGHGTDSRLMSKDKPSTRTDRKVLDAKLSHVQNIGLSPKEKSSIRTDRNSIDGILFYGQDFGFSPKERFFNKTYQKDTDRMSPKRQDLGLSPKEKSSIRTVRKGLDGKSLQQDFGSNPRDKAPSNSSKAVVYPSRPSSPKARRCSRNLYN